MFLLSFFLSLANVDFFRGMMITHVFWKLNIKVVSENNCSEHWFKKAKRHDLQKLLIKLAFLNEKPVIEFPCSVSITRIAPRKLDIHDNLPGAMKWIVDAIADNLIPGLAPGRADSSPLITWEYRQIKGLPREYALLIHFIFGKLAS